VPTMNPAAFRLAALLAGGVSAPTFAQAVAANINVTTTTLPSRVSVMSAGRWTFTLRPSQPVLAHPMGGPAQPNTPMFNVARRGPLGLVAASAVPTGQPTAPRVAAQPPPQLVPRPATVAVQPPALPPLEEVLAPRTPAVRPASQSKDDTRRRVLESQFVRAGEGSESAQFDVGMRYLSGDGVAKDADLARTWLTEAALNGHSKAAKKLAELDADVSR